MQDIKEQNNSDLEKVITKEQLKKEIDIKFLKNELEMKTKLEDSPRANK